MKKKILYLIIAFVVGFSTLINNVNAEQFTPDLAEGLPFHTVGLWASVQKDGGVANTQFKYVYDSNVGRSAVAYCVKAGAKLPDENSIVRRVSDVTNPQILYILQHGYHYSKGQVYKGDLNDLDDHQAYYVTQLAVWMYLGPANGGYDVSKFNTNLQLVQRAKELYEASKSATSSTSNPYIINAVGSYELKYDDANKRYITDPMHVTGYNITDYTVTLKNAPAGTKLIKANGQEFASGSKFEFKSNEDSQANGVYYISVPASSVTANISNMELTVSAETYIDRVYRYESTSDSNAQPLFILIPTNYVVSDTHNYKIIYQNKSCEQTVNELKNKYSNRSKSNSNYITDLNKAKNNYPEINTDAGVDNPRCTPPTCDEVLNYLKGTYGTDLKESNKNYKNEINGLKDKYGINLDAGYENPKCSKPSCEEVVTYLKNKYSDRSESNTNYMTELNKLKEKYGIYTDQGVANISCEPAPGKPSCKEKKDELYAKYPNPADRNSNNSTYMNDVNEIVRIGQENGWTFYIDDIQNPDCVKHYKREIIIRKVIKDTDTDLAGATLVLSDASGNKIAEWVTDGTGKVFTDLAAGTYTVTETVAPEGYNLGSSITFEIKADQDEYSLEFKIEDSPLPNTADINFTLIITAFILFLGFGIFGLIKTSQREEM